MDLKSASILVTGGRGFLGSHIVEELLKRGVTKEQILVSDSKSGDLRELAACIDVTHGKDLVIHCAANVGGIGKNRDYPWDLWHDNIIMGVNMLDACRKNKVSKAVILGTICEYPKFTPVPFSENNLWNGYPEETNAPYGVAKKDLLVGGQALRKQFNMNVVHLLPVNLYGPRDNFDLESSHVIPAMIRKIAAAKRDNKAEVVLWGDGTPTREFLFVSDAAEAIVRAAEVYDKADPMNLGTGREISMTDLAELIKQEIGFKGKIVWDASKPNGQMRRCLDVSLSKRELDWEASTKFEDGIKKTVAWFHENIEDKI